MLRTALVLVLFATFIGCRQQANQQPAQGMEPVSEAGMEAWEPLFNGNDLSDWVIKFADREIGVNYKNTFRAEDGMIRVVYDEYETFGDAYAHMYYRKPYSYYKLRFDYRFTGEQTPGGEVWNNRNSGIMVHSQSAESNDFGQDFPVSIEVQLLGGLGDGERHTANLCTPGTAVEINGAVNYDHCIDSASETYNGDGWVHVEVVVLGGESITHIVEGDTVLTYQKPQITGFFINQGQDQADWSAFGISDSSPWRSRAGEILTEGYISLQAESHPIDFRNIELLDLCGCTDPKAANYKSYYVKSDSTRCRYE